VTGFRGFREFRFLGRPGEFLLDIGILSGNTTYTLSLPNLGVSWTQYFTWQLKSVIFISFNVIFLVIFYWEGQNLS